MNKARRTQINKELIAIAEAIDAMRTALENLENLQCEEQECFDNMPEGLQASENGQRIERIAEALEYANSSLDMAIGQVDAAVDELAEAVDQ